MSLEVQGLLISFAYLFGVVIVGELIRALWRLPSAFTRKFIHIGVGFWGFIALRWLPNPWMAVIPPALFILVNALSFRWTLLKSMEIEDKHNLGTVYYPLSLSLLILIFWNAHPDVVLVGLLAMTMGDGVAAIVGRRWGRHTYRVWGVKRTVEGSAAMAVFALIGIMLALEFSTTLSFSVLMPRAFAIAILAAFIEGVSPRGSDNLTVPLGCAVIYSFLF